MNVSAVLYTNVIMSAWPVMFTFPGAASVLVVFPVIDSQEDRFQSGYLKDVMAEVAEIRTSLSPKAATSMSPLRRKLQQRRCFT